MAEDEHGHKSLCDWYLMQLKNNKSIRQAKKLYGIPASNIHDWKIGKTSSKKIGHQTYLTKFEKMAFVVWCFTMQKVALCVTLNMLNCTI